MLRGARVAARRNLELRVVPLPAGSDPADLVAAGGRAGDGRPRRGLGAVRALPRRARAGRRGPVERRGQGRGRSRALRPVFARTAAQRDARGADRARRRPHRARARARGLMAGPGAGALRAAPARPAATAPSQRPPAMPSRRSTPRAVPSERSWRSAWRRRPPGRRRWPSMDLDAEFSSDLMRRAAAHVPRRSSPAAPPRSPTTTTSSATLIAALDGAVGRHAQLRGRRRGRAPEPRGPAGQARDRGRQGRGRGRRRPPRGAAAGARAPRATAPIARAMEETHSDASERRYFAATGSKAGMISRSKSSTVREASSKVMSPKARSAQK